jgi:hypothetical protein
MQATIEAKIDELTQWVQGVFPDGKVLYDWITDDTYLLYRVHRADGKRSEIQFAEIALEDYSAAEIVQDLAEADTATQLRSRTSHRFTYGPRRSITPIERMIVRCDEQPYLIVRNPEGFVAVFDDQDRPLTNMPRFAALPSSIFLRQKSEWIGDIRTWR